MRVLIVEDDDEVSHLLRQALGGAGHAVDIVDAGIDAIWMATEITYDAIVLDVNIPDPDGFEVCKRLRAQDIWAPVLFLTGRDDVADRVKGLNAGGDDYLVKPISMAELAARLQAVRRRGNPVRPVVTCVGDLEIDPSTQKVRRRGIEVSLSPREFRLVETLAQNPGDVLSRDALHERLWDFAFEARSNVIDTLVRRVRAKLDLPGERSSIETVRGVGYRMVVNG